MPVTSSKKIERLTDAQVALFPQYVAEWTRIGLSCEPIDQGRSRAAVELAYKCAGLSPPKTVIFAASPVSGGIIYATLKSQASVGASVRDSVVASVGDSVVASVGDSVYGPHEAGWLSFYAYMRRALSLERETDKIIGLLACATECGWFIPMEQCVIIEDRHRELHRDDRGRLHNESGMAFKYADGWGDYYIHGVRVPEKVVLAPQDQTTQEIESEQNFDVRSIRIDRYGWERYLSDTGAECIDSRKNDIEATSEYLCRTKRGEQVLLTWCPSTKRRFALPLPADTQIRTCAQAQNWLWSKPLDAPCRITYRT